MSSQFRKSAQSRSLILAIGLFIWCAIIFARLINLQLMRHAELGDKALRQQQQVVNVVPRRGVIYDRLYHELAISVDVDSLAAWGSQVKDARGISQVLAPVLQMDAREIEMRLTPTRGFVWIKRKLDKSEADAVRGLHLKGFQLIKESKRFYPKRELAAQVLGYVGVDNEGLGGIEYYYDKKIKGIPGRFFIEVDARRRGFGRRENSRSSGHDAILTIDENIQYIAQKALNSAMERTGADVGTAIVMNPHNGEILALANAPDFNPNRYKLFDPNTWKDHAVQSIYEPGSTFKIITVSAALAEGLTTPDEVIDCQNGSIVIAGHTIHDHDRYGLLTVSQIIAKSSGVGTIKLGLRLGEERMYHYIRAFGFGAPTGIDLPGEAKGIAREPHHWSKISIGAISFGQEIGVTSLQMLRAFSTLANDGVAVRPSITKAIVDSNGKWVSANTPEPERVVSARTAVQMKKILEGVVLEGTGRKARLDGYTAAGKTGTAQKTDPTTGRYYRDKYVASFVGFTPVNNPEIALIVVLDSPRGGQHQGGQVAAPAWKEIAEQTLRYLGIPAELPLMNFAKHASQPIPPEMVTDFAPNEELQIATNEEAPPPSFPEKWKPSSPPEPKGTGTPRVEEEKVFRAWSNTIAVPSLVGKSMREAMAECQRVGLELVIRGSGFVVSQEPAAGGPASPQSKVVATFVRRVERRGL